jgi:undecaprenyl-diphosphatase
MIVLNIIQTLKTADTELLLAINGSHSSFFDVIMYGISNKFIWIPLYVLLMYISFRLYGKKAFLIIGGMILAVVISDQISVHLFKNVFQRYRPCHNIDLQGMLHLVNDKCGGKFGFISSHASNTATVATMSILFFGKKFNWLMVVVILYALLNSYSRVYLGVHYPSDVIAGMAVGVFLGIGTGSFVIWLKKSFTKIPSTG